MFKYVFSETGLISYKNGYQFVWGRKIHEPWKIYGLLLNPRAEVVPGSQQQYNACTSTLAGELALRLLMD